MTEEPIISIADAARRLGINKSTLSRQVAKGAVRSRERGVVLSEVEEDRRLNLYPGRSGRHAGRRDHESVASPPLQIDNPVASAVVRLLGQCGPVVAKAAIKAGCPLRVAYALAGQVQHGLNQVGNQVLQADCGPGFTSSSDALVIDDASFCEPDWNALAALTGETIDFDAWHDWMDQRGL